MKAYDSISWDFLFSLLRVMKFPTRFIEWIRKGVTIAQFSINLNGSLIGYFRDERGLRQGDPISPYLFVVAMEAFSMLRNWKVDQNGFHYYPKCEDLKFTHYVW